MLSYADGGLDQTLSVSGSTKVGKWTQLLVLTTTWMEDRLMTPIQGGEDAEEITVTDGTLTVSLVMQAHISSQSTVAQVVV